MEITTPMASHKTKPTSRNKQKERKTKEKGKKREANQDKQ
jgi:hypothetical protein